MKRRKFISYSGIASASAFFPTFLSKCNGDKKSSLPSRSGKITIIIQLSGGNDGLNTFVPYTDDLYYKSRPSLAISKNKVLKVTDSIGFNPALSGLRSLYDEGYVSIINNVGYPNSSRSHFNSTDIWHSAISRGHKQSSTGWIGRYLDSNCNGCDVPYHAMELEDTLSLALVGKKRCGFAVSDAGILRQIKEQKELDLLNPNKSNDQLNFLTKTLADTKTSAAQIAEKIGTKRSKTVYPKTEFAQKLKLISELITSDIATNVFYISHSGFDTHAAQANRHAKVLQIYSEGVQAFVKDLKINGLFDDTLIMTFSEFGRRVAQNSAKGTDHGKANNLFLIGNKLNKAGFYNNAPNLANLDNGDLKHDIDFRQVYATVLDKWIKADSKSILLKKYDPLNFV